MALILSPASAWSAFKSSQDGIKAESAWNPNPADDDIELPMPCGISMVLRPVDISTPALIVDKHFPMGIVDNIDPDRQLYEDKYTGYISSPFTLQTLPQSWQKKVTRGKDSQNNLTWYFIGKYEVSRLQWDVVMNTVNPDGVENPQACPASTVRGNNLPVSGISWFEAQSFLSRYNSWLIKNHPDALPAFPGTQNLSFLRLPTEEEWEYAARGGGRVPPDWWQSDNFFPTGDKKIEDFGIFNHGVTYEGAAPIGSRSPNPLGLYDTAGNVSEMVDGLFRMSIADRRNGQLERRLHGASGGLVTKGGNFRSDPSQVLPGNRDEHALYSVNGAVKSRDIGFRLVLGGLNMDGGNRKDELRKEVANPSLLGEKNVPAVNIDDKSSSLEALESLVASTDGDLKQNLMKLKSRMQDEITAQSQQDSRNLEQAYRSLLFQAETLRSYAFRYSTIKKNERSIEDLLKKDLAPENRQKAQKSLEYIRQNLAGLQRSIIMGANYYKTCLEALLSTAPRELSRLGEMTRSEYRQLDDIFNRHMLSNIDTLEDFISKMRSNNPAKVNSNAIIKAIIPPEHYKLLPLSMQKK